MFDQKNIDRTASDVFEPKQLFLNIQSNDLMLAKIEPGIVSVLRVTH